jgi:hypothetical protein
MIMASTITNKADKSKLVDQMLEDMAGEEFDEFSENDMYATRLSRFVEDEPFADIDGFH